MKKFKLNKPCLLASFKVIISRTVFSLPKSSIDITNLSTPALIPIAANIFIKGSIVKNPTSGVNSPSANPVNVNTLANASTGIPASIIAIISSATSGSVSLSQNLFNAASGSVVFGGCSHG